MVVAMLSGDKGESCCWVSGEDTGWRFKNSPISCLILESEKLFEVVIGVGDIISSKSLNNSSHNIAPKLALVVILKYSVEN